MLKKDKEKVFGGEWTEESMGAFLTSKSHDGTDADYLNIMKAYQHMVADTFAEFIVFFKEQGGDINAKNLDGLTAFSVISEHAPGQPYAAALKSAGAE